MLKMFARSVCILLVGFETSKVFSDAFTTYCSLPCPFMGPALPPNPCGGIQLPARRPVPPRSSFYDNNYADYDETPENQPPPPTFNRQKPFPKSDPPPPTPKPDPKPPPEDPEPPTPPPTPAKKKTTTTTPPPNPSIQPSRRFFTSLFSIPGAVVDTLVGGEIVL